MDITTMMGPLFWLVSALTPFLGAQVAGMLVLAVCVVGGILVLILIMTILMPQKKTAQHIHQTVHIHRYLHVGADEKSGFDPRNFLDIQPSLPAHTSRKALPQKKAPMLPYREEPKKRRWI